MTDRNYDEPQMYPFAQRKLNEMTNTINSLTSQLDVSTKRTAELIEQRDAERERLAAIIIVLERTILPAIPPSEQAPVRAALGLLRPAGVVLG